MKVKEEITCKVFATEVITTRMIIIIIKGIIIAIRTMLNYCCCCYYGYYYSCHLAGGKTETQIKWLVQDHRAMPVPWLPSQSSLHSARFPIKHTQAPFPAHLVTDGSSDEAAGAAASLRRETSQLCVLGII